MNSATQHSPGGVEMCFSEEEKALLAYAADIEGCSVERFVQTHVQQAVEETIRRHSVVVLNREDSIKFAEALLAPPKPASPRMKEALAFYRATVTDR